MGASTGLVNFSGKVDFLVFEHFVNQVHRSF